MNCECNTCVYRGEHEYFGTIMVHCDYVRKNKYDVRMLVNNHCNKYIKKENCPDCSMCKEFVSICSDCRFISCDFKPIQLTLFGD